MNINPRELEKEFNNIGKTIVKCIINDSSIPMDLFSKYKQEYQKISKIYQDRNNKLNLLHVNHNFFYRKSNFMLHTKNNPTEALISFLNALSCLIKRHDMKSYNKETLRKMLKPYNVTFNKIITKKEDIGIDRIISDIEKFIFEHFDSTKSEFLIFKTIIEILCNFLTAEYYDNEAESIQIKTLKEYQDSDKLSDNVDKLNEIIIRIFENNESFLESYLIETKFKIFKKQFYFLVRNYFFESDPERKENLQLDINKKSTELVDLSLSSLNQYKKFLSTKSKEYMELKQIKLIVTFKELNILNAKYLKSTYVKKDIFEACKKMDEIKQFLVRKTFYEQIPLTSDLFKHFSDEWAMLYVFSKICLLKMEASKYHNKLKLKWQNEVMGKIRFTLEDLEKEFKYEIPDDRGFKLKIIAVQFAGSFSEYFIHKLFQEFFDFGPIDERTPPNFKDLFTQVKNATNKDCIILNDRTIFGDPDIDILVKGKCVVFLKNAIIKEREINKIKKEISSCVEKNIHSIFIGFNFIKNMENMNYIRKSLEEIVQNYKGIRLTIFDIKDLVSYLLDELYRGGKSKINFSRHDFFRATFDY